MKWWNHVFTSRSIWQHWSGTKNKLIAKYSTCTYITLNQPPCGRWLLQNWGTTCTGCIALASFIPRISRGWILQWCKHIVYGSRHVVWLIGSDGERCQQMALRLSAERSPCLTGKRGRQLTCTASHTINSDRVTTAALASCTAWVVTSPFAAR